MGLVANAHRRRTARRSVRRSCVSAAAQRAYRRAVLDADGKTQRRWVPCAKPACRTSPCSPIHHRRHVRQFRDAGRHQHRRTGSVDRLRRPARDRADGARDLPEGFSGRNPARPRRHQICDRRELRDRIAVLLALLMKRSDTGRRGQRMSRKYWHRRHPRAGGKPISADSSCAQAMHKPCAARRSATATANSSSAGHAHLQLHVRGGAEAAGRRTMQLMGPIPTPAVAHLTRTMRADGGIVISASHNPHYDNGIKFFSARGEKLTTPPNSHRGCAESSVLDRASGGWPAVARGRHRPLRRPAQTGVATSTWYGSSSIAPTVDLPSRSSGIARTQRRVDAIGVEPGSTNNIAGVGRCIRRPAARVRETGRTGIADGDGDRLLSYSDGRARRRRPAVRAGARLEIRWPCGPGGGTLMTNGRSGRWAAGIAFIRAKVGDRWSTALLEHGGILGGEASGHLLC